MNGDGRIAFSPQETAGLLGVCLNTIYKWIRCGRLQSVKLDRKILIPRTEIERFLHPGGTNSQ